MKRLDELGVSPAPWITAYVNKQVVYDRDGRCVADCDIHFDRERYDANARLIAAAPELYDIVWEMVHERCRDCKSLDRAADRCLLADNSCFQRWRKALEKAGGKE